jgi:hypothetical protein
MNHIKILNNLEVKTSQGTETLANIELKLKTLNIEFNKLYSTIRVESFVNNNIDSLPIINETFAKLEVSNELFLESLLPILCDEINKIVFSSTEEETFYYKCVNLLVENTIWHNEDLTRNIRVFSTWKTATKFAEENLNIVQVMQSNNVPTYDVLGGKWMYFNYLDAPGSTYVEDLLKSYGAIIQRR